MSDLHEGDRIALKSMANMIDDCDYVQDGEPTFGGTHLSSLMFNACDKIATVLKIDGEHLRLVFGSKYRTLDTYYYKPEMIQTIIVHGTLGTSFQPEIPQGFNPDII